VKRIVVHLDEEEVSSQVSSLKNPATGPQEDEEGGLGIENGTFKWNEAVDKTEDKDKTKNPAPEESVNTLAGPDEPLLENDHKFELKDISVMFPEGELTIITGPTASGKTALLVCPGLSMMRWTQVYRLLSDGASWRDDSTSRPHYHVQEHVQGRRARSDALNIVRCTNAVASPSVNQGKHSFRLPIRRGTVPGRYRKLRIDNRLGYPRGWGRYGNRRKVS
jgi:hypothetical protein